MTGLVLSVSLFLLAVAPSPAPLICTDPTTGDKKPVKPPQVERALKAARDLMKQRGVHILDLPTQVQDRRRRLPNDLAAKDWCIIRSHVVALEGALSLAKVDQGFLSAKFSRVERWVRAGITDDKQKADAERILVTAAAQMADRKFEPANKTLNRALALLFGSADLWALPEALPALPDTQGVATSNAGVTDPEEVKAACPTLVKKGAATQDDFDSMRTKVAKLMDQRRVRLLDIKAGEQLSAELASYRKLNALFPATRVLCAIHKRVNDLEVDLGSCMKRFQGVNHLREGKTLSDIAHERFSELVRSASDHIAKSEFAQAHGDLDDLLVLLGEPRLPSAALEAGG
jgi:hypothetical protein